MGAVEEIERGAPQNTLAPEKTTTDVSKHEGFYVEFAEGDSRDPAQYTRFRKWCITLTACAFSGMTAATSASFSMGITSMIRDLRCTQFEATLASAIFLLFVAIVPLFTSSFSEEFGRKPVYLATALFVFVFHIVTATAPSIQVVVFARAMSGAFGSTGATLVGGSVADLWLPHERGFPMSAFAGASIASTGLGPVIGGFIEANPHLEWRWIQWVHAIVAGVYVLVVLFVMKETRSAVILRRLAKKKRKETGDQRYISRAEEQKQSLRTMIWISCTRPLYFLGTEPLVITFALYIFFVWGVLFCLIDSVSHTFETTYGFDVSQTATVYLSLFIGTVLGFFANMYQDVLYRKYVHRKGPEARLYIACVAALAIPTGMFIFAWTSSPRIHWVVPAVGLMIFMFAAYVAYLVVFLYLADCYGTFASSANAGQSLCRNFGGFVFPLFSQKMYNTLTYRWSNTLFGFIGVVMVPIPFVLYRYGAVLRRHSAASRKILEAEAAKS
ncbi:MFS general substrate transporter [Coniophora puteana RWD-64-598 SS2]|uniref:MFS general substrate transporter n=1 Tax=Coniophora puteana (strain RWD-64-598) TaxID=741705 RepID=A0A5M3MIH0_CONPW|nr:MFS general substrate transporter [Coniophora puteana RWD-64-598 SS2]EIW79039.1 MFS general substrate transporter [Coniophora puteana RWD-64-598 SS2]